MARTRRRVDPGYTHGSVLKGYPELQERVEKFVMALSRDKSGKKNHVSDPGCSFDYIAGAQAKRDRKKVIHRASRRAAKKEILL